MRIQRAPCTLAALLLLALTVRTADDLRAEGVRDVEALPIRLDRPSEVFSSGESVSGNVVVPPDVGTVEQVMLQWRVTPARSGAVLHQGTHTARLAAAPDKAPTVPFDIPLPSEEGAYNLQITLFAGAEPRHATVQVVVVSPVPRSIAPEGRAAPRHVVAFSIPEDARRAGDCALRLRIGRPGLPHRVVASFARGGAEPALTILDATDHPDIASRAEILPATTPDAAADAIQTREFIFWPRSETPLLLMEDADQVSRFDVYELPGLTPAPPPPSASGPDLPARWMGPRLRNSHLVEHFATRDEQVEPHDWVSVSAAAARLVEALHTSGADSLLLSVGVNEEQDVVELLYRLFEREGLTLLPEPRFSAPLPVLEALCTGGGPTARGVELVGRDGRTWREHSPSHATGPLYNPLHPAVQEAVLTALSEFVNRYASHRGFRGVAVGLGEDGYLQFPSLDWGYDDETVARFERETKLTVPAGPAEDRHRRRYEFLTGPARAQWDRWRASELAAFHRRMADVVTAAAAGAHFVLSGGEFTDEDRPAVFVDHGLDQDSRPGLKPTGDPSARERLARALAAADVQMAFGADWIVTRGGDPESWSLRRTLQALPAIAFHRHQPVPQPVVIRVGRAGDKTLLYALNEFAGPVTLDVQLSCPAGAPCRPLGLSAATPLTEGTTSGSRLQLRLEPFGLWAGEIAAPAVQISGVSVAVDELARARLQSRVVDFAARVTEIQQAGRPAADVHAAPASAEEARTTAEPVAIPPGEAGLWQWSPLSEDQIELTSGRREPAGSGNLNPLMVVSVVARADADSVPLRLSVGTEGTGANEAVPLQVSRTPARYSLPCRGLSAQGPASLRIENRGMAPVRIDAVTLRTYRLTPDELRELTKTVSALSLAWEERRYADCHRLLESDGGRLPFHERVLSARTAEPVQP